MVLLFCIWLIATALGNNNISNCYWSINIICSPTITEITATRHAIQILYLHCYKAICSLICFFSFWWMAFFCSFLQMKRKKNQNWNLLVVHTSRVWSQDCWSGEISSNPARTTYAVFEQETLSHGSTVLVYPRKLAHERIKLTLSFHHYSI